MTDRIVAAENGLTYMLDGTQWHIYRITTKNDQFKVYVDENSTPVLVGTLTASTNQNRVMFGCGDIQASPSTQDIEFDYVRYTASGDLLPGEGDGGGSVAVSCTGQEGDEGGLISASSVPFNQYSYELNKIRFVLRDVAGNTGYSPIYNVHIDYPPNPDLDNDGDVDQEDYGVMQSCYSGDGALPEPGCGSADLDEDNDVDVYDAVIQQQCMGGPNNPPDPGCPSL
jgi:hypothetical protein